MAQQPDLETTTGKSWSFSTSQWCCGSLHVWHSTQSQVFFHLISLSVLSERPELQAGDRPLTGSYYDRAGGWKGPLEVSRSLSSYLELDGQHRSVQLWHCTASSWILQGWRFHSILPWCRSWCYWAPDFQRFFIYSPQPLYKWGCSENGLNPCATRPWGATANTSGTSRLFFFSGLVNKKFIHHKQFTP